MSGEEQRALEGAFGEGVQEVVDRNRRLIIVPKVTLPAGSVPAVASAIYHASAHGSYATRLFFEAPITGANGVQPPVTTEVFFGRTMYAASFNGVPADLPPHQGILAHLRLYEAAS